MSEKTDAFFEMFILPKCQKFVSLPHRMEGLLGSYLRTIVERRRFPASVLLEHKLRKSQDHNGRSNEASAQSASYPDVTMERVFPVSCGAAFPDIRAFGVGLLALLILMVEAMRRPMFPG